MTTPARTGTEVANPPADVLTLPQVGHLAERVGASLRRVRGLWTRADSVASAVVVLHLVPVLALVLPGWLFVDDLRAQAYAAGRPLFPFVVESNRTHLAPGARTVDWLMTRHAPLEHWPAVAVTVVVSLALGAAAWWLLRELVGPRSAAVAVLAVALLSPLMVPSTAWFRQLLTTQVGLVCVLVALATAVRSSRRGSRVLVPSLVIAAVTAVGVSFSERAVAAVPLCLAAAALLGPGTAPARREPGGSATTALRTWSATASRLRRAGLLCLPSLAVMAAFLLAYSSGDYDRGAGAAADPANLPKVALLSLGQAVLPALLGGPWRWETVLQSYGLADPPLALVLTASVAGVAALAWALLPARRATTVRVGLVYLAYAGPVWGMLWLGRLPRGSLDAVRDYRLWPDLSVLLVCLAAPVLLGVRPTARDDAPRPAEAAGPRRRSRRLRVGTAALAVAAVVAVTAGGTVSWVSFARQWSATSSEAYVERLRQDLRTVPGSVLPSPVPDDVVPGWVQADLTTADLVRALVPDRADVVTDDTPLAVDENGRLQPARLSTVARALPAPQPGFCGRFSPAGTDDWVEVPFARPVPYLRSMVVHVGVLVADSTALEVRMTGRDRASYPEVVRTRELRRGPHVLTVLVPRDARPQTVLVRSVSAVATCVPEVSVAQVRPS